MHVLTNPINYPNAQTVEGNQVFSELETQFILLLESFLLDGTNSEIFDPERQFVYLIVSGSKSRKTKSWI